MADHAPLNRFNLDEWVCCAQYEIVCKSSPSPPPVPSAASTAQAQGASNVDTAAAQAALNNVNQITPYGSTTYNQTGTYNTPGGETVPTYTQTTALNPLSNAIYTGGLQTAGSLINSAGTSATTPLNFNTADSSTLNSTPQQLDTNAANAVYQEQASFLNPQFAQSQTDLEDQLSRQGIPVGSDAYNSAMTNFNNSKTQAYQAAQDSATAQGAQSASQLFNLALAGQQQNIAQQQTAQSNPISLAQSILGASPTQQPIVQPSAVPVGQTNVLGAQALQTNAAQSNYQAELAQNNALFGGLAGLGGTLGAAAILS